jgi:hypothetical protein
LAPGAFVGLHHQSCLTIEGLSIRTASPRQRTGVPGDTLRMLRIEP